MLEINWTVFWNIFNILLLFFLLRRFLFKPITKMMDERKAEIENNLREAQEQKEEARRLSEEYEENLEHSREEGAKLVAASRENAQKEYETILSRAREDARAEAERSRSQAEREKEKLLQEVQGNMTELVLLAAGKLSQKELSDREDQSFVDSFLAEVGAEHEKS